MRKAINHSRRPVVFKEKSFLSPSARENFKKFGRDVDYGLLRSMVPQDFERLMQMSEFAAIAGYGNGDRVFRLKSGREVDLETADKCLSQFLIFRELWLLEQIFKNLGTSPDVLIANLGTDGRNAKTAISAIELQALIADFFPLVAAVRSEFKYPELSLRSNQHLRERVMEGIRSDESKWTVARMPDGNHSFDDLSRIISTYFPEMDGQIERHILGRTNPGSSTVPAQALDQ